MKSEEHVTAALILHVLFVFYCKAYSTQTKLRPYLQGSLSQR